MNFLNISTTTQASDKHRRNTGRLRSRQKQVWRNRKAALVLAATCLLLPHGADAHIKWFCAYDTTVPPLRLAEVLTPVFLFVAACFATIMFLAYVVDKLLDRSGYLQPLERVLLRCEPSIETLIRAGVCAFFVVLSVGEGTILTPELKTTAVWVPRLQLLIAAFTLWRPTLALAGIGIAALYAYGVVQYGAFHMLDYPIFLGIAAYLVLSSVENARFARVRLPMLYFNLVMTMMWGAIEKFGYPYWTFPLLATHKGLTLGIPFNVFMIVAGFVELSLAFFMLTGSALLRLSCLALLALMGSAIPEFGKVDAIGHSVIMLTLIVMIIAGQNGIQMPGRIRGRGVLASSSLLTLAYGATTASLLVLYHMAQYVAGR